ncbi:MAG: septal ring lytic transglycosylase RlpA family protein [Candidatus Omnitrophica bacterium]|nr:septal ring lytic transglycosylase RlpA family protein [Candidatus Omnitrophota bacterium]
MASKRLLFALTIVIFTACADNTPVYGPYPKTGLASWHSSKITSTGEKPNRHDLICSLRKKDFGKYYKVCNTANGKCVRVRHNDFGPSRYFYNQGRIIDLSREAFSRIAGVDEGIVKVTVEEE